ncbi:hypothetical protein PybrP1_009435 [[Pythium] brassicae (nom. inval.)]|nr:hypothetical protein PybrP1_009435 [[Pythium] brassicae (nom. inval.)]
MDEVAWKCSAAFALGVATHYVLSRQLQSAAPPAAAPSAVPASEEKAASVAPPAPLDDGDGDDSELSDESDWEEEGSALLPHKMVLCVRTDLKMGKGKIAAQCCHATLGAYKRAVKRAPAAVRAWETLGQAKVCLKVDSEEEMLTLAATAAEIGLIHYVVVDAGRTQIAPDTKTVLSIGPAPIEAINAVTGHLKLM